MPRKPARGFLKRRSIVSKPAPASLKPQQARSLIRRFHTLQKNRTAILARIAHEPPPTEANYVQMLADSPLWRDHYVPQLATPRHASSVLKVDSSLSQPQLYALLGQVDAEIAQRGGLAAYQAASIHGQDSNRGGDSSKKLVEWLSPYSHDARALEIGCLDANNAISTSGLFSSVTRIDLNSQSPHILQQDFMERPLPRDASERFHMVSCSLVLNFVPTPRERGDMLLRITKFLHPPSANGSSSLFFVLPLPCLQNSRYISKDIFETMMAELGFTISRSYEATKIIYYLFDWNGIVKPMAHPKKQICDGAGRNNFCIVFG
ncbi:25S rRNA adenine-N(1) methyltransferase [[Candida] zeylanoides]